jgi:hypothetical protein
MCVRCPIAANVEHSSSARREGRILGGYNRRLARPAAKPKSAVPFDALRRMGRIAHTSPALADKTPRLSPLKHGLVGVQKPGGGPRAHRSADFVLLLASAESAEPHARQTGQR